MADLFANKLGNDEYDPVRIKRAALAYLHQRSESRGDLYATKEDLVAQLPDYVRSRGAYGYPKETKSFKELTEKAIEELIVGKELSREYWDDEEVLYISYNNFMENRIVQRLHELVGEDRIPLVHPLDAERWIEAFQRDNAFTFAKKQREIVQIALSGGISILTGGPGTGKTQTINAIIQCLKHYKKDAVIHLLAPTGKASKRMSELTGIEAMTIHRGIGLGHTEKEDDRMLGGDFVIVDEVSMMDVRVCYHLLQSIEEGVSILFVGDVDQLPSVGPGLVLRDFIRSGVLPTVMLDEIFRQAEDSLIVTNSHKAIKGLRSDKKDGVIIDNSNEQFFFIERGDVGDVIKTVLASIARFKSKGFSLDDIQVLSPMVKGAAGAWSLNKAIQQEFNKKRPQDREVKLSDEISYIRVGDRVLHTENNQNLEVFNGETGVVQEIFMDPDRGEQVLVLYDNNKEVYYSREDLDQLELAYAMSIHKSQGSEYPVVIMVCHSSVASVLNRNSLYTGWTRAKKIVANIGELAEMNKAIDRVEQMARNSKITEKLKRQFKPYGV